MKIEKIKDEALDKHFEVTVAAKEMAAIIETELMKLSTTIKMPGFRAGKIPIAIVKKKYGSAVHADTVENQVRTALMKIVQDNKLTPSSNPKIEDIKSDEGKELSFVIKLEILPEINAVDLKKINIERPVLKISTKDVDEYLAKLVEENPVFTKESKTKTVNGDQVTIDFVGYVDKKAFEGGTLANHKLVLGSKTFIPGFEDQLIGHKAGDDVKVQVTFPEAYHAKDLAGKEAIFETKIHAVHKSEKPAIDNDLGKRYGFEDLEAFKKDIERILKNSAQDDIFDVVKMRLFDKLENLLTFDVPSTMLESEFNMIKNQAHNFLKQDKNEEETEKKKTTKKTKDEEVDAEKKKSTKKAKDGDIDEEKYRRIALRRVRIGMFISDYAKNHGVKLENSDINAAITKQARMFPENRQFIIDYYTKNKNALESLKGSIMEEKTVKLIVDKEITIKDKEYSAKEMEKFLENEVENTQL